MTTILKLTYAGFNYADYYNGEYSDNNSLATLDATDANSVALTPDFGIDIAASTVYAGGATTDTVADLTTAISDAKTDGLTSFVRPLVDYLYPQASTANPGNYYVPDSDWAGNPNGYYTANLPAGVTPQSVVVVPVSAYDNGDTTNYRGFLSPADINVSKFFGSPTSAGSYDAVIVAEAKAAQAAGASLFSIGTELDSLATDTNPAVEADWTTLIADVRAVFTGKLTYSANWATAGQVTFWNKLDLAGIDGYVPLSNVVPDAAGDNNPSLASLIAGWTAPSAVQVAYSGSTTVAQVTGGVSAIDYFDRIAQQTAGKQFIFSELGYQNDTGAATDPTGGSATGVTDPALQAELYQAFFDAWGQAQQSAAENGGLVDGIPFSLAGAYFWAWNPDPGSWDPSTSSYDNWQPSSQALGVITAAFSAPAQQVQSEITAIYEAELGRAPDPGGLAGFTQYLATGGTLAGMQAIVAASPEAQADLSAIYQTELGRAPDPGGLAGFTQYLATGGTLAGAQAIVAASPEAEADLSAVYQAELGRAADTGGLASFTQFLAAGGSLAGVQAIVAGSAEAQGDIGALYQAVLGRAADPSGRAAFTSVLDGGGSLAQIRAGLAYSGEAKTDVTNLLQADLGAPPGGPAVAAGQLQLADGLSLAQLDAQTVMLGAAPVFVAANGGSVTVPAGPALVNATGGATVLTGFDPAHDVLELSGAAFPSVAAVFADAAGTANGVLITSGVNPATSILLHGVSLAGLQPVNLRFD